MRDVRQVEHGASDRADLVEVRRHLDRLVSLRHHEGFTPREAIEYDHLLAQENALLASV